MHRLLAAVLPATLLALTLACSQAEPPVSTTPVVEGPQSGARIYYEFEDGVDDADRKIVPEASEDSRRYFAAALGRDLKLDITVETNLEDGEGFVGTSFGRRATLLTGSPGWPNGDGAAATRIKSTIVAHEIFHNFQSDLIYTDDAIPSDSPRWIVEGSAEYAAARYEADRYGVNWNNKLRDYERTAREPLPRLDDNSLRTGRFYAKSFLGVNMLMQDRPLSDLGDYFVKTGYMDWEDAFLETFGETPQSFVDRFESARD
jgi:hypothetical protein